MKKSALILCTAAFVFSCGFLGQQEDGSVSVDTSGLAGHSEELAKQADVMSAKAIEKAVKAAESVKVTREEILDDLTKPIDAIKQKAAGMDPAQLIAYLNQYSTVLGDTQQQITDYTAQLKELKWTQQLGSKGKELKKQISMYTDQLKGLTEQCIFYIDKLESYGIDLQACGIDLSAFGL